MKLVINTFFNVITNKFHEKDLYATQTNNICQGQNNPFIVDLHREKVTYFSL